jgi:hypothetical protein
VGAMDLALRAVIAAARRQGMDVELLCSVAMESLLEAPARSPVQVGEAVLAIEVAANAQEWRWPAVG